MALPTGIDPSVITPPQSGGNSSGSAPTPSEPLSSNPVVPAPPSPQGDQTSQFPIPPQAAPAITQFPPAAQMVSDLQASGALNSTATPAVPPPPTPTAPIPVATPKIQPAVHLANTAPTFHRPTAEQLLQGSQLEPKRNYSFLIWFFVLLILLGAIGWIVYSQMRMQDQTLEEFVTSSVDVMLDPQTP